LERIAASAIGPIDVFKTSLMKPIIDKLEEISGKSYDNNTDEMRVITDHIRGAYLLAAQGLMPSNKGQGYVLRRLLRRAILRALDLGISSNFLSEIAPIVAKNYADLPDSILTNREIALDVMLKEENAFRKTLNKGLKELNKLAQNNQVLDGRDLFKLQDTYGFPMELSVEECFREGIELSKEYLKEFNDALAEQRERSQTASKGMFKGGLEDHGEMTIKYHTACHLLLAALQKLISPDIVQKGSNITAERVRFDFNLGHKMTPEELSAVESQVNEWILADLPVTFGEYEKNYAKETLKAHGEFWDKYPDNLKVYTIGDFSNPISREVCGGPHVEHTSVLGKFKIKKEESSSAGVRRIKAILD
ncbi:alanine--tRNA ligase, partial [Candidatus Saccharibacteria bacterium]|nr:alanine--tRNA ligase [Candidatus Saccharibacteria bacterium]